MEQVTCKRTDGHDREKQERCQGYEELNDTDGQRDTVILRCTDELEDVNRRSRVDDEQ